MRKQFKSIVAAVMAVLMLMSISMTAMAAEQVPTVAESLLLANGPESSLNLLSSNADNGIINETVDKLQVPYHLGFSIKVGKGSTVKYKITCYPTTNSLVNIRFQNNSTGESRSFSAVGDGKWDQTTYVTDIPAGTYSVWVIYVDPVAKYNVQIVFPHP